MDDDDKIVIKAITVIIIAITISVSGCVTYMNKKIADSSDPLAAACAMGASNNACVALGSRAPR